MSTLAFGCVYTSVVLVSVLHHSLVTICNLLTAVVSATRSSSVLLMAPLKRSRISDMKYVHVFVHVYVYIDRHIHLHIYIYICGTGSNLMGACFRTYHIHRPRLHKESGPSQLAT